MYADLKAWKNIIDSGIHTTKADLLHSLKLCYNEIEAKNYPWPVLLTPGLQICNLFQIRTTIKEMLMEEIFTLAADVRNTEAEGPIY